MTPLTALIALWRRRRLNRAGQAGRGLRGPGPSSHSYPTVCRRRGQSEKRIHPYWARAPPTGKTCAAIGHRSGSGRNSGCAARSLCGGLRARKACATSVCRSRERWTERRSILSGMRPAIRSPAYAPLPPGSCRYYITEAHQNRRRGRSSPRSSARSDRRCELRRSMTPTTDPNRTDVPIRPLAMTATTGPRRPSTGSARPPAGQHARGRWPERLGLRLQQTGATQEIYPTHIECPPSSAHGPQRDAFALGSKHGHRWQTAPMRSATVPITYRQTAAELLILGVTRGDTQRRPARVSVELGTTNLPPAGPPRSRCSAHHRHHMLGGLTSRPATPSPRQAVSRGGRHSERWSSLSGRVRFRALLSQVAWSRAARLR